MASVDLIAGDYTIAANSTPDPFTFWWPPEQNPPGSDTFFDVSIAEVSPGVEQPSVPLEEVSRVRTRVFDVGEQRPRWVLLLTLHNPNPFEVTFRANHIRVRS
jgi:hypothetical protein